MHPHRHSQQTTSLITRPGSESRLILLMLLLLIPLSGLAAEEEPVSKHFITGVAIGGHDTVAYHGVKKDQPHEAVQGDPQWKTTWKGAEWLFASKRDRDLFAADPERYAPAYNGHCANALSLGEGVIRTDGSHWQIFGDRLYNFYAARGRERWLNGDFERYREQADRAWRDIIKR